ncbi:MAG: hypothetical protein ACR2MX_07085 [Cyclobacteriaceae bacterium]
MNLHFTKKTSQISWLLAFLGVLIFSTTGHAQQHVAHPGVVSQLTLDNEGKIQCLLHTDDAVTTEHHNAVPNRNSNAQVKTESKQGKKVQSGNAQIFVDYFVADPNFPADQVLAAINSFQSAVDIWAQTISSDEPIFVAAVFQQLGPGVLGSAGPTQIYANAPGLERDTWYGNALADKLAGEDLNPTVYDIVARFSTVFPNWYYGTDGNTPASDFDFRTVVLHELGHGLGFFGSMFVDNTTGIGDWGFGIPNPVYPAIYDRLAHDRNGKQLLKQNKFPNFSTELGDVLLDDPLVFRGPRIVKATNGKGARIFTVVDLGPGNEIPGFTNIWLPGSSYSHMDFFTYRGTEDGLMVPFLSRGLSLDDAGPIVRAIFDDMGWNGKVNKPFNAREALVVEENPVFPEGQVKIYPNPILRDFSVDLGKNEATLQAARLIDAIGRSFQLSYTPQVNPRFVNFESVDKLTPGMYILELHLTDQSRKVVRFVQN